MTDGRSVLVVDDEWPLRMVLSEFVLEVGFEPVEAANGQEALAQLHQHPENFCLIMLDIMMPVMNGLEFRQIQQRDPVLRKIPVIAMSADPRQLNVIAQFDVVARLEKPLDYDRLVETIEHYCC